MELGNGDRVAMYEDRQGTAFILRERATMRAEKQTRELGRTALWVAAMRALESEREDALFWDPFARDLAGASLVEDLRRDSVGELVMHPAIAVRTRWLDDQLMLGLGQGIRQVVILAAGMDARAYRLPWPSNTRLFELDQAEVLDYKHEKLAASTPRCDRRAVPVDLEGDWPAELRAKGFVDEAPTIWVVEGLLVYLREDMVTRLVRRLDALSVAKSIVLLDVVGRSLLASPRASALHSLANEFGTDEPETLLEPLGWYVNTHSTAAVGNQLGRWPFPVVPRGTVGVPFAYLVHGRKRRGATSTRRLPSAADHPNARDLSTPGTVVGLTCDDAMEDQRLRDR